MSKLSLLDKLSTFIEVALTSYWSLIILVVFIAIGITFFLTNKNNAKRNKIIYIVFTIIMMAVVFITYNKSISKLFDYMMNNLFIIIYFPNIAIYFAAIIITNIILWISVFSYKTSSLIKRINIIVYTLMNYLLVLILHLININKIDIFNHEAIYTNKELTSLIELSSIVFIIWVVFLIIYKVLLIVLRKDYKPKVKKVLVKKVVKKLPENYNPVEIPTTIKGNIIKKKELKEKDYAYVKAPLIVEGKISKKKEEKPYNKIKAPEIVQGETTKKKLTIKENDYNKVETPIIVQGKASKKTDKKYNPVETPLVVRGKTTKKKDVSTKVYEDMLSVEDYKLLLKLLLKEKQKETEPTKEIEVVKETKKIEKEVVKHDDDYEEEANLTELENLYRSIR